MELGSITRGASLYGSNAISERVAEASRKPLERLSQQVDSTRVQLSAFGQVKSATAQVEATAGKLQESGSLSSAASAAKVLQNFADAANNQVKAVRQDALPVGSARTANELRRALEGPVGTRRDELKQIGLSIDQTGSIKVDAKVFEKAYQTDPSKVKATLEEIGKAASSVAGRQLSEGGAVGGSISRLTEKLGNIERSQADYQSRLQQSQRTVDEQERRNNLALAASQQAFGFNGIGAYSRILSF